MSTEPMTTPQDNGAAAEASPDKLTPFEERYMQLKAAKLEARQRQSEMNKVGDELVALQKRAREAEEEHKRALKKVDALKEGLSELFAIEMRNY